MFNWLIIIAIFLILMALKLTKFLGIALILALLVMMAVKSQIKKPRRKD